MAPTAAAAPPTVEEIHIGPEPAPVLTEACGFPVTRVLDATFTEFNATNAASPVEGHSFVHVTAVFTGPSGRTLKVGTTAAVIDRRLNDGTLVEATSGGINLIQSGRSVVNVDTLEQIALVGHLPDASEFCRFLTP